MARKILVIDDDVIAQNMLQSTLTTEGYSVSVASGGEEGLEKAVAELPDLIILDIMMPGMDGVDVAGFLKTNPSTEKIPIIFLSSLIMERGKKKQKRE
jgi:CheY-like chemotaxis protein